VLQLLTVLCSSLNSDIVSGENTPGTDTVPDDSTGGSTEAWKSWIDDTFGSVSHPISTCAMMSQANGGVVGADLKVHGTSNIRVADASVLPMQVSAHLSATIYGVGEMAADLIKASHSA
jgi:choline dehydrogenase